MGCAASVKKYSADESSQSTPQEETKPTDSGAKETTDVKPSPPTAKDADQDSEDDDGEDDVIDDSAFEEMMQKRARGSMRAAISAENSQVDSDWKAPVHEKTADQETRLTSAVQKSFVFSSLQPEDLATVIKSFKETPVKAGTKVIQQGDEVTSDEPAIFVLEQGTLDVFKNGTDDPVFTYDQQGQFFGDLAVLYNAPRAATVVAKTDSTLWSIDRTTFTVLVKDASRKASEDRAKFLKQVPILQNLQDGEISKLQDALVVKRVEVGDTIIHQSEEGNEFFLIEAGRCEARKDGEVVATYNTMDYFGELALLNDAPRAATVVALEPCRLLVLGRKAFKRLLGPLDDLLKERQPK